MQRNLENYRKAIKKDLLDQLRKNGTTGRYYLDLVEDYMKLWDLKNELFDSISERGVIVRYDNGGGQRGEKRNDSIQDVLKVSDRMTRILDRLGVKPTPETIPEEEDCDL